MSEISLGLSSGKTTCASVNLLLNFDCSVSLRSQDADLSSFRHLREELLSKDIWICKGHDFRFSFRVVLDDERILSTGLTEDYLEQLLHTLEAAELWSQLSLRFGSISQETTLGSAAQLESCLKLKLDACNSYTDTSKDRSPSYHAPAYDAASLFPPKGIPIVYLQNVNLLFRFSALQPHDPDEPILAPLLFSQGDELLPTSSKTAWSDLVIRQQQGSAASTTDELNIQESNHVLDDLLFFEEDTVVCKPFCEDENREMLQDPSSPRFTVGVSGLPPALKKPTRLVKRRQKWKGNRKRSTTTNISTETMLRATDAAFRNAICVNPIGTARSTQTLLEYDYLHLTQLAPAIFVPTFSRALAARREYIPGVATFLSVFVEKNSQVPIGGVQNQPRSRKQILLNQDKSYADQSKSRQSLVDVFSAHLWMTAINGLDKTESARRLKLLGSYTRNDSKELKATNFEDICAYLAKEQETGIEDDFVRTLLEDEHEEAEGCDPPDEYFLDLYDEHLSSDLLRPTERQVSRESTFDSVMPSIAGLHEDFLHDDGMEEGQNLRPFDDILATRDSCSKLIDDACPSPNTKAKRCTEFDTIGVFKELTVPPRYTRPPASLEHEAHTTRSEPLLMEQDLVLHDTNLLQMPHTDPNSVFPDLFGIHEQNALDSSQPSTIYEDFDMLSHKRSSGSSVWEILGSDDMLGHMSKQTLSVALSDGDLFEIQTKSDCESEFDSDSDSDIDIDILRDPNSEEETQALLEWKDTTNPSPIPLSPHFACSQNKTSLNTPSPPSPAFDDDAPSPVLHQDTNVNYLKRSSSQPTSAETTTTPPETNNNMTHEAERRDLAVKRQKILHYTIDNNNEGGLAEEMLLNSWLWLDRSEE